MVYKYYLNPITRKLDLTVDPDPATNVEFAQGDTGDSAPPDASGVLYFHGTGGISTASDSATNSVTIGTSEVWNFVTGTIQAMVSNERYVAMNASQTTLALPTTSVPGDIVAVEGYGAGGWVIIQGTGQQIIFLGALTTSGGSGNLWSSNRFDGAELVCVVANQMWKVIRANGNLQVV